MYYSRHDTGLDTSTRLPRERTAYPPAGFNPSLPTHSSPCPTNLLVPLLERCVFLSFSRVRDSFSSPPRWEIAIGRFNLECRSLHSLSRVSRMTFDEIRFPGKEKETRMSLSSSPRPSFRPLFLLRIQLPTSHSESLPPAGRTKNPLLAVTLANLSDGIRSRASLPRLF